MHEQTNAEKKSTLLHDCNFRVQETRQRSKDITLAQKLVAYGQQLHERHIPVDDGAHTPRLQVSTTPALVSRSRFRRRCHSHVPCSNNVPSRQAIELLHLPHGSTIKISPCFWPLHRRREWGAVKSGLHLEGSGGKLAPGQGRGRQADLRSRSAAAEAQRAGLERVVPRGERREDGHGRRRWLASAAPLE